MAQWSSETVVAEYSDVQVRYSSSLLSLYVRGEVGFSEFYFMFEFYF